METPARKLSFPATPNTTPTQRAAAGSSLPVTPSREANAIARFETQRHSLKKENEQLQRSLQFVGPLHDDLAEREELKSRLQRELVTLRASATALEVRLTELMASVKHQETESVLLNERDRELEENLELLQAQLQHETERRSALNWESLRTAQVVRSFFSQLGSEFSSCAGDCRDLVDRIVTQRASYDTDEKNV